MKFFDVSLARKLSVVVTILPPVLHSQVAKAEVNIRRVAYTNLVTGDIQPTETSSDFGCGGTNPFADPNWRANGFRASCTSPDYAYGTAFSFNFGASVPEYDSYNTAPNLKANRAVLSLEEIEALRASNPGAIFRFEIKISGIWQNWFDANRARNLGNDVFLEVDAGCASGKRVAEIQATLANDGGAYSNWYVPRYSGKKTRTKGTSLEPFNYFNYFDLDFSECDRPLQLQIGILHAAFVKFEVLETNVYICSSESDCADVKSFNLP